MDKSLSFLLIDDNKDDVELVKQTFKRLKLGNPLVVAGNGAKGLEALRAKDDDEIAHPRVVFLDLHIPIMDGFEFLKELRQDVELKNTLVFMMTPSDNPKDIELANSYNVQGYITKPLNLDKMLNALSILQAYGTNPDYDA